MIPSYFKIKIFEIPTKFSGSCTNGLIASLKQRTNTKIDRKSSNGMYHRGKGIYYIGLDYHLLLYFEPLVKIQPCSISFYKLHVDRKISDIGKPNFVSRIESMYKND